MGSALDPGGGAISGAVVGLLPFLTGDSRFGWQLPVIVIIAVTVMSVLSAVVSTLIARSATSGRTGAAG